MESSKLGTVDACISIWMAPSLPQLLMIIRQTRGSDRRAPPIVFVVKWLCILFTASIFPSARTTFSIGTGTGTLTDTILSRTRRG